MKKINLTKQRSACPVTSTLDLIGDKWTLIVVRDLLLGATQYKDFLASPEHIATNILADRLSKLVDSGLVEKAASNSAGGREVYTLTETGRSLTPILQDIKEWGLTHIAGTDAKLGH